MRDSFWKTEIGAVIIDANSQLETKVRNRPLAWRHTLQAKSAFITRENINRVFEECGFSGGIGLLSIDIDGNDYWVWEAIASVDPVITICEYNAALGDLYPIVVPYDPAFTHARPDYHNLYGGASIVALQLLATRKGYTFLGSNSAGNSARQTLISSLPVINIETEERMTIGSLGSLCSEDWLRLARRPAAVQSALADSK